MYVGWWWCTQCSRRWSGRGRWGEICGVWGVGVGAFADLARAMMWYGLAIRNSVERKIWVRGWWSLWSVWTITAISHQE